MQANRIIISRTDGIGDVILTLPLCGALKQLLPQCKIGFLGRSYTQEIISGCKHVDEFLDWDKVKDNMHLLSQWNADTIFHVFPRKEILKLAKKAKIPSRIGTMRRWSAIGLINKPLFFSRKKSQLHEAQLNLKMLSVLGLKSSWSLSEIPLLYGFTSQEKLKAEWVIKDRTVVLHPMSHGSAIEWPIEKYSELASLLLNDGFQVAISGTQKERDAIGTAMNWSHPKLIDLGGQLSLGELLTYLGHSKAVVAASTGPLHMGAALGIRALGLYSPKRPIFPTRWAPLGTKAGYLVSESHPLDGKLPFSVDKVFTSLMELLDEETSN